MPSAPLAGDGQRFRVLRPHARGGLGEVFVALDGELNREVALKQILDRHADDPASRQRFLLEAEITGGLEHPGIVPVYGLGSYADGRPFYAMRFIRGDSLKEAIEQFHADASAQDATPARRSLELRKLLRRFLDVCNAIDYAHSRGVLHRDLKPGNIMVGQYGETLVVDWGLAKPTGRAEPGTVDGERTLMPVARRSGSAETLPGSALGTPAFMSPEQAAGDLEASGRGRDVYSLGATLYCLLTGRAAVRGRRRRGPPEGPAGRFPAAAPARRRRSTRRWRPSASRRWRPTPEDRYAALPGAGRRRRALAGRRAGVGLARAARAACPALGAAEPDGGHGGGGGAGRRLVGLAAVAAVQARSNSALKKANGELAVAGPRRGRPGGDARRRWRTPRNPAKQAEAVEQLHGRRARRSPTRGPKGRT